MMELGANITTEPVPFVEQEMFWNFDNNEDELEDPLDLDVVVDQKVIGIKLEDTSEIVTSSQNDIKPVVNDHDFIKLENNMEDSKAIVSSSSDDNHPIVGAENCSVLPTGLLLYRLFNQIIMDALLGSAVNTSNMEVVPSWNNTTISAMANTQNWVNNHQFVKKKYALRKSPRKRGSVASVIKKGKVDVIVKDSVSEVNRKQKCNLCDKLTGKTTHSSMVVRRNGIEDGARYKCTICNVDRRINGLTNDIEHISNENAIAIESDSEHNNNYFHYNINFADRHNKNFNDDGTNVKASCEVSGDNISNGVIKKCNVVIDRINFGDNRYYICNRCDTLFTDEINFENHKLLVCNKKDDDIKQENENHLCCVCGKLFAYDSSVLYEKHLESHSVIDFEKNKLSVCNKKDDNLRPENENYLCCVCGKLFAYDSSVLYDKHLESHGIKSNISDSLNYPDKFSDKLVDKQNKFVSDVKLSGKKLNFFCSKCCKSFNKLRLFKMHNKKFHDNEMFSCNPCSMIFSNKLAFLKHNSSYHRSSSVKDHVCHICRKGFARVVALKAHINKEHNRKKLFTCRKCSKSFIRNSSLLSHTKLVHDGFCNEIFVKI